MTEPQVTIDKDYELKKMAESPIYLGRVTMPKMFKVKSPRFHYELEDAYLDKKQKRINIIAPRGHGKSSIGAGVFPLHHLFFDEGQKVIVLCSKTQKHAIRLLGKLKNDLNNSKAIKYFFGEWGKETARVWKDDEITLKDGSTIFALGMEQQVTGFKVDDQRITLFILDDPEDQKNTKNKEIMESNFDKLLQQFLPALDMQSGRCIVIGTPQRDSCMVEQLKDTPGFKTYWYSAIINEEKKEVLWADHMSFEKLMLEKATFTYKGKEHLFYTEYMCQLIDNKNQLFKRSYFRYWDGDVVINESTGYAFLKVNFLDEPLPEPIYIPVNIFAGIDPASSTRDTADYSVDGHIAMDAKGNVYILPYFRDRVSPFDLVDAIKVENHKYRPNFTRIEKVQYQEMLAQAIDNLDVFYGAIYREEPRGDKNTRLESLQNFWAAKRMFHKKDMKELEGELLFYPNSKHDDIMDAIYYATKGIYTPSHEYFAPGYKPAKRDNYKEKSLEAWKVA